MVANDDLDIDGFRRWALRVRPRSGGQVAVAVLDIDGFRRWALGELRENRNRGVFAEWLVGKALGVLDDEATRLEWMPWDLEYREKKIEVKASGQAWSARPRPRFDIAPRKWTWLASTDSWIENDPPARPADVYVFCLHTSEEATNENVADPHCWQFWVISRQTLETLDKKRRPQKSVGPGTLDHLTRPAGRITWPEIKAEVDRCTGGGAG